MKKILIIIFTCFLTTSLFGQEKTSDEILSVKESLQPVYTPEVASGKQLYLKMSYGSSVIANPLALHKIKGATVACIEIVCSDDPKGIDFSGLTRKRIENLRKLNPELFQNKEIKWKLVRQTSCADSLTAARLFHGIVITYRPSQSKEKMKAEVDYLKKIFFKVTPDKVATRDLVFSEEPSDYATKKDLVVPGYISPWPYIYPTFNDSTVTAVLKRNKWPEMLIAADLTGSMSPYTAQLFIWLKLNTTDTKVKQFVFFNDGDMTPDHKKVIGKTGGIYHIQSFDFEDVQKLAYKTMSAGGGGDAPENNLEALIKGIELCPDAKNIILIADNWAPVKDISLLSKIKKPVKIVLCGADYGINPDYLTLARATGGSVHTMEKDLTELTKLNEGQEIKIKGEVFRIEKGRFVLLKRS